VLLQPTQVQEGLVDAINFYARHGLPQVVYHAPTHVAVEGVVRAEHLHLLLA
jgi:hypothetical protein